MKVKNRDFYLVTLCVLIWYVFSVHSQLSIANLSQIGIIQGKNYQYKIAGDPTTQFLVIKLVPNIIELQNCSQSVVIEYKNMITRILRPIEESLRFIRSTISDKKDESGLRFWGAVVGGVALGIATSAQITAGVALHNSLENAKAITQLKDAMLNSNKAIQELHTAQAQTVIAINAIQDQINNQLVPSINKLGCNSVMNTLGLRLNQYFSELSLVFGPNLRDPTSETLSIQAISKAFNNDFDSLFKKLGYTQQDFLDLIESDSIRGRIIDVMVNEFMITIQIEYPSLATIPDATIQTFNLISYNHKGSEWMSIFPSQLLIRGNYISNIDINPCTKTSTSVICKSDTSSPISTSTYDCTQGLLGSCARTRVVNSHVPRYALSEGVLFANCIPVTCRCQTPLKDLIQDVYTTNLMISNEVCEEIFIDGIFITLGKKILNRGLYASNITLGGIVSVEPIDIGNEINSINTALNKTQDYINQSNEILNKVNPHIVNTGSFTTILVIGILLLIWFIITLFWLIYLTRKVGYIPLSNIGSNRSSTINSLSGLVQ